MHDSVWLVCSQFSHLRGLNVATKHNKTRFYNIFTCRSLAYQFSEKELPPEPCGGTGPDPSRGPHPGHAGVPRLGRGSEGRLQDHTPCLQSLIGPWVQQDPVRSPEAHWPASLRREPSRKEGTY